jgi:hypothetical protein
MVQEEGGLRELSDLLLTHEFGCFLIESKALAIFGRAEVPDRQALKRGVVKAVKKAVKQLTGACGEYPPRAPDLRFGRQGDRRNP